MAEKMSKYFIPDNLVIRVCSVFDGKKLYENDYFQSENYDLNHLLVSLDKEYVYKSLIMKVVQEGVLHDCCPLHVNVGLCEIIQIIRANFSVGKGNVNFGSTLYCDDPSKIENCMEIIKQLKDSGTVIMIAKEFENKAYVDSLIKHKIIPLVMDSSIKNKIEKEDFIFLSNIRKCIEKYDTINAYLINERNVMKPITFRIAVKCNKDRVRLLSDKYENY